MRDHIVQVGDAILKSKAKAVAKKDLLTPGTKKIIQKMKKALEPEANGVAIAAPQVGESLRIFVISHKVFIEDEEVDSTEQKDDMVFINPELVRTSSKKWEVSEGCLSVRDVFGTVRRYQKATVKALDENGKEFTLNGSGLLAQIFQHEIDHLNGTLFIDKAIQLDDPEKLRAKFSARRKK